MEDGGAGERRWETVLHSDVWGKFQKRLDGTTESRPSSSLILTYRATLENDWTGRETAVRPRPTLRTDGLPRCEHWADPGLDLVGSDGVGSAIVWVWFGSGF